MFFLRPLPISLSLFCSPHTPPPFGQRLLPLAVLKPLIVCRKDPSLKGTVPKSVADVFHRN